MKIFFLFLSISLVTLANDGFYQGSGSTVIPIENKGLRVKREYLELKPNTKVKCYEMHATVPMKDLKDANNRSYGTIGKETNCNGHMSDRFRAKWHARAEYEVEALTNQTAVQMGFPIPSWSLEYEEKDGLNYAPMLSAVNFKVTQNGKNIPVNRVGMITPPPFTSTDPSEFNPWRNEKSNPAFLWNMDFKAGGKYTLVSEYDFAIDHAAYFSDQYHYLKDKLPWFDDRTNVEAKFGNGWNFYSERVLYFLHPLKQWANPPPDEVLIRVEAATELDVTHFVSKTRGLSCIDEKAIYFKWNNEIPPEDLSVSYPASHFDVKKKFKKMDKQFEYFAWTDMMTDLVNTKSADGKKLKFLPMSCGLVNRLVKQLGPKTYFAGWVKDKMVPCVEKCQ